VNGCQGIDGLELDYEALANEQVKTAFTDSMTLVLDLDRSLPSILDIPQSELDAKSVFVDRLEESGSENPMDLDRCSKHLGNIPIQLL
jgi:hypothetical protein